MLVIDADYGNVIFLCPFRTEWFKVGNDQIRVKIFKVDFIELRICFHSPRKPAKIYSERLKITYLARFIAEQQAKNFFGPFRKILTEMFQSFF